MFTSPCESHVTGPLITLPDNRTVTPAGMVMDTKLNTLARALVPWNCAGSKTTTVPGGPDGAKTPSLPSEPLLNGCAYAEAETTSRIAAAMAIPRLIVPIETPRIALMIFSLPPSMAVAWSVCRCEGAFPAGVAQRAEPAVLRLALSRDGRDS